MAVYVEADDLKDFRRFYEGYPERASQALSLAINDTMRNSVLPEARKEIYAQVNLPVGYLDQDDRLDITQFATPTRLVGIVRGRDRPTSLANFATSANEPDSGNRGALGKSGKPNRFVRRVTGVKVRADGPVKQLPNAFLIDLKRGSEATGNVGLAIKLRPGETVTGVDRFDPVQIFPNVYILYGPSVDQIFRGVASDIQPKVMAYLETEFYRQFARLG